MRTYFKGTKVYTYVKFSLKTILCSSGCVCVCQMVGVVVGVKDDLEESVCDG